MQAPLMGDLEALGLPNLFLARRAGVLPPPPSKEGDAITMFAFAAAGSESSGSARTIRPDRVKLEAAGTWLLLITRVTAPCSDAMESNRITVAEAAAWGETGSPRARQRVYCVLALSSERPRVLQAVQNNSVVASIATYISSACVVRDLSVSGTVPLPVSGACNGTADSSSKRLQVRRTRKKRKGSSGSNIKAVSVSSAPLHVAQLGERCKDAGACDGQEGGNETEVSGNEHDPNWV